VRSLRLPLILLVAGVAAILFLVYSFIVPRNTVPAPSEGGTYTEGVIGAPQVINPLLCQPTSVDNDLCSLVFRGLTRLDPASGDVAPDLAQIRIDSATQFTAVLRDDARWEDGAPVNADDVIFTTSLLRDQNFPGDPSVRRLWQTVNVNKIDEKTVRFELTQPFARFLDFTAIGLLPRHILSGTIAADLGSLPFNLQPRGNGPWRVTDVTTANGRVSAVTLEPSSNSPGPKPKLARLVFRYYASSEALFDAYRNRDIDGMAGVTPADAQRLSDIDDAVLYAAPQARIVTLYFNLRRDSGATFLSELPVRQALMYALDRDALVRDALGGRARPAITPFLADSWAFNPTVRLYSRDLERSRQLLREAGYELRAASTSTDQVWQKDGEPIGFTIFTSDNATLRAVAEQIAKQWRELGVQVTVQSLPNIQRGALQPRTFQAALVETLLEGDPDPYSLWHGSQGDQGKNFTGWNNTEVNELLDRARANPDRVFRYGSYARMQEIFAEELPAITLYYPVYQYAISSRVRDVQLAPLVYPSDRLRTINAWSIATRRVLPAEATRIAGGAP
jgi:peptide/nickel transport system substrate-binding protein